MAQPLIAIVDDDDLVRASTALLLDCLGFDSRSFASAEALLDTDLSGFDCILSDVQMPGMSGIGLGEALMAREARVPLLLMTAYPTNIVRAYADRPPVVALLEKPLASDHLLAAMGSALAV